MTRTSILSRSDNSAARFVVLSSAQTVRISPAATRHTIIAPMAVTIVLLGPPGSGKGTRTSRLRDDLGLDALVTGDLLRVDGARTPDAVAGAIREAVGSRRGAVGST